MWQEQLGLRDEAHATLIGGAVTEEVEVAAAQVDTVCLHSAVGC